MILKDQTAVLFYIFFSPTLLITTFQFSLFFTFSFLITLSFSCPFLFCGEHEQQSPFYWLSLDFISSVNENKQQTPFYWYTNSSLYFYFIFLVSFSLFIITLIKEIISFEWIEFYLI